MKNKTKNQNTVYLVFVGSLLLIVVLLIGWFVHSSISNSTYSTKVDNKDVTSKVNLPLPVFDVREHPKSRSTDEILSLVPQNASRPQNIETIEVDGIEYIKAVYDTIDLEEAYTLPEDQVTHHKAFGYIFEQTDKFLFFYVSENQPAADKWFEDNVLKVVSLVSIDQ